MRLKDGTYEAIKKRVVDLLDEYGVTRYPLDVFALVRQMRIRLIPYSQLDGERRSAAFEYSDNAFRIVASDYSEAFIFYNDAMPLERARYSVAHELAHIVLEHGSRDGDDETESEADFFAAYLLMPVPLVYALCSPDPEEVSVFFGTSRQSASFAVERTKARLRCGMPPKEYELRLMSNILAAMRGGDALAG